MDTIKKKATVTKALGQHAKSHGEAKHMTTSLSVLELEAGGLRRASGSVDDIKRTFSCNPLEEAAKPA